MTNQPPTDDSANDPIEKLHAIDSELIIGLVGAVGTDLNRVGDLLERQLRRTGYQVFRLKISKEIIPLFGAIELEKHDEADRINKLMDAQGLLRQNGRTMSKRRAGSIFWDSR